MLKKISCVGVLGVAIAVSGCANNEWQRTQVGAGVGTVAGALLGRAIDKKTGTWVGAAVGALAGGAVGNYMDRQQHSFEQALASERQQYNLQIQRLRDGSLKLNFPSQIFFDVNQANIKPNFEPTLAKVAQVLNEYQKTTVTIYGYTDSTGTAAYNQELSQRRANSVVRYLENRGVLAARLQAVGRGENNPVASNNTPGGRQLNRRVEMIIHPITTDDAPQGYQAQNSNY